MKFRRLIISLKKFFFLKNVFPLQLLLYIKFSNYIFMPDLKKLYLIKNHLMLQLYKKNF